MTDPKPSPEAMTPLQRAERVWQTISRSVLAGYSTPYRLTDIYTPIELAIKEAERQARAAAFETCAQYHEAAMDEAAANERHEVAQFHSDSADAFRALATAEAPRPEPSK